MKKKILLIATGGTIASAYTHEGLSPQLPAKSLLSYIEGYDEYCEVEVVQAFSLDSTDVYLKHWQMLTEIIRDNYDAYDGFVICHGTDTMSYTGAALSYMIQNSSKPIVITGAQKPIDLPITDARTNLGDSLRFASHDRAHGVNIVFGGKVIAGTRAKKEKSKSYNAFSSINYPVIAMIIDGRIAFYIDDKEQIKEKVQFYTEMNDRIFLLKLIPGMDATILNYVFEHYDGVIIESYGVGGLPTYGDTPFYSEIKRWIKAGKIIVMATQVTHEGSDMGIYRVGKVMKENFSLMEAYDMTLEATVTKTMWALAKETEPEKFSHLFYQTINHDILFN